MDKLLTTYMNIFVRRPAKLFAIINVAGKLCSLALYR